MNNSAVQLPPIKLLESYLKLCNFPPRSSLGLPSASSLSAPPGAPSVSSLPSPLGSPPGDPQICCAVSGGADSAALLVLSVAAGFNVKAIHVDHQIRPGSDAEVEVVSKLAAAIGADFEAVTAPVSLGSNLEARARQARYDALPDQVLVAHTKDDQAETVLLNLLRGAGLAGMAGMRRDFGRPLLELRRRDTQKICELAGYVPLEDPMNRDPAYRRSRIRHELLPLLCDIAGRDVVPLLARTADLSRDAESILSQCAPQVDASDAKLLQKLPEEQARWAIREWIAQETGQVTEFAAVMRILKVAVGEQTATEIPGGFHVRRSKGRLSVSKVDSPPA